MPILKFQTNIPIEVRLRSIEGKPVESQFGGIQYMFGAEEGAFYVSDTVGGILMDQFRKLGVRPGEPVEIWKAEVSRGNGRKAIQWTVAKVGFVPGEQPNGTLAVPQVPSELEQQLARSIALAESRKQPQQAQEAAPAWAAFLVSQSNVLIDAYSQVLTHASQYPNVRGEDVRSIFLSTFINVSKSSNGGRNAA
jgi:hypothetical protein